jgi:hypothetical protein
MHERITLTESFQAFLVFIFKIKSKLPSKPSNLQSRSKLSKPSFQVRGVKSHSNQLQSSGLPKPKSKSIYRIPSSHNHTILLLFLRNRSRSRRRRGHRSRRPCARRFTLHRRAPAILTAYRDTRSHSVRRRTRREFAPAVNVKNRGRIKVFASEHGRGFGCWARVLGAVIV